MDAVHVLGNVKFELSGRWTTYVQRPFDHLNFPTVYVFPGAISARLGAGMVLAFAAISWSALAIAIPPLASMIRYFRSGDSGPVLK